MRLEQHVQGTFGQTGEKIDECGIGQILSDNPDNLGWQHLEFEIDKTRCPSLVTGATGGFGGYALEFLKKMVPQK